MPVLSKIRPFAVVLILALAGLPATPLPAAPQPGATAAAVVAVQPDPGDPEPPLIRGQVLNREGQPVPDARVVLVELQRAVFTDEEGRFVFSALPPGLYHVESISRREGSGLVEATLEEDGRLEVVIRLEVEAHAETVTVTASARGRGSAESYTPTSTLNRAELLETMQPTLGETLNREPGVNSTSFGPGSSRPVIRGQTAGRIRILEGGIGVGDASTVSPDHAVATDPLSAERVEIVRGAGTLLYGSTAVGGVVNILDRRIPTYVPQEALSGELDLRGGSVADEKSAGLLLDGGAGSFAWHVDALARDTHDVEIPGPAVRGEPDSPSERLPNSALESEGATVGGSWVGESGYVGLSLRGFETTYGIPAELEELEDPNLPAAEEHGAVSIDLEQRRADVRGGFTVPFGIFDGVRFMLGATDYEHREREGDEVGTVFQNEFQEGRVELPHGHGGKTHGVIGLQVSNRDYEAIGAEAFVPPSDTTSAALFGLHEWDNERLDVELGLRFETVGIDAVDLPSRDFDGVSASAGLLWRLDDAWRLGGSVSRTERAPSAEELFSNGPHLATLSFERGDPDLDMETALGVDVSLRRQAGRVTGELNLFLIDYTDYIFEALTGEEEDGLPVFQYGQADAEFTGFEASLHISLYEQGSDELHLQLMVDAVSAELSGSGESLPFIPPLRAGARLHYRGARWHAYAGAMLYDEQDDIAAYEQPTDGYTMVEASVGYRFKPVGGAVHELLLRGTNLTDRLARNHVSRLRNLAPLPGRDISLAYRLIF